jgi:hypothetical protein
MYDNVTPLDFFNYNILMISFNYWISLVLVVSDVNFLTLNRCIFGILLLLILIQTLEIVLSWTLAVTQR